ncbi:hypothetical protein [Motiliproteus sp. MSK22-1]|uniref:hypothetical protein n=1 Tax=Motiliproteus sp. MSK22-1 TaxID=1897630 RepID=UPI00117F8177|nr:hypothetical protein [Motiliproteus sp. MSK22-1]
MNVVLLMALVIGSTNLFASHLLMSPLIESQSLELEYDQFDNSTVTGSAEGQCNSDADSQCSNSNDNHCLSGCFGNTLFRFTVDSSWYQPRVIHEISVVNNTHPAYSAPTYRPPIA